MKTIRVACAIIINDEKVLVTQRSELMDLPLKWEFPGGKVEAGESAEQCLHREIIEELNIKIEIKGRLNRSIYDYGSKTIELLPFIARVLNGSIQLREHKDYRWVTRYELHNLDWAKADIPIVLELRESRLI